MYLPSPIIQASDSFLSTPSRGSFCYSDHIRGEFSPTGGRRLQFFENLIGGRALEWTLVLHLRFVRAHSTTDDRLLLRRQIHDRNLAVSRFLTLGLVGMRPKGVVIVGGRLSG